MKMTTAEYVLIAAIAFALGAVAFGQWIQSYAEIERYKIGCWETWEKGKAMARLSDEGYKIPIVDMRPRVVRVAKVSAPVGMYAPIPRPAGGNEPTP